MKISNLILLTFISNAYAYDSYLGNLTRAAIFEKTDLNVGKLTINLEEEDFNRYFLTYQCLYDTNLRYRNRNDECYSAPWINLDSILEGAIEKSLIKNNTITDSEDLELLARKNITLPEFEHLFTTYTNYTLEDILSSAHNLYSIPIFETENAGMTLDIDGNVDEASKIKIAVGGKYTKNLEKLGFNIKIKKGEFLERKQLRLRTEAVDPSFIREKLAYDICNIVGLPSLSANYVRVFFNEKFMGFYILRDAFKSQWIEYTFGEKSTKHLYTCDSTYGNSTYFNCKNDDETITKDKEWENFLKRLGKTKTREELEEFFDVKTFIKWQALKYLFGSWDHLTNAHNQVLYMYHDTTSNKDMWIPLLYDFDSEFGSSKDVKTQRSFEEESLDPNPLYKLLKLNDKNEELISYIDEIMRKAFNPKSLFARIDQLKELISPYVKEDRTPGEDGRLPGRVKRIGIKIEDYFDFDDFDGNTDFTMVKLHRYISDTVIDTKLIMGLKQWIIERFLFACKFYSFDCSYASEFFDYAYETHVIEHDEKNGGCHNSGYPCCTTTKKVVQTDKVGDWGVESNEWCLFEESITKKEECWSEAQGYPCCKNKKTKVYYISKDTKEEWGVENDQWCGITDLQRCPNYGVYKCCEKCNVYYTDTTDWGVEHGNWCSIRYSCSADNKNKNTTSTITTTTTETIEPTESIESIEPVETTELVELTTIEANEIETSDVDSGTDSEIEPYNNSDIEILKASNSANELDNDAESIEEVSESTDIEIELDYDAKFVLDIIPEISEIETKPDYDAESIEEIITINENEVKTK